jgi:hypothetical protein
MLKNIDMQATGIDLNDYLMSKNMAEVLHAHYPNHQWAVTCEGDKGIATVRDLFLSGQWGYILKLPAIYSGSAFEADVIKAGGEILERFGLKRGKLDEAQLADLKTDFAGNTAFDK